MSDTVRPEEFIFNAARKLMFKKKIKSKWTYGGIVYRIKNNDNRIKIDHISKLRTIP